MLTSAEIRQQYIDFFVQKHGHTFVPSSPVVPVGDPTLLFTNAGMNQFKPYFLGTEQSPWKRVANTQKCIRAGGKHNDLDDVGRSRRHHTFFEMLGNWSFGDYFKVGAIQMAWELLTKVWKLDPRRLHVSCFEGDEKNGVPRDTEAADIWKKICGVPDHHIHYFGKDNFWEMGDTGPCGPCTEIYIDRTPDMTGGKDVNGEDPRVMEIWNLVFIQYNRNADRSLAPLPAQHVDTGMGFERITQVIQGADSNFGIDLWNPFFAKISEISGHKYTGLFTKTNSVDPVAEAANPQLRTDIAFRVIADHARCLTFALTDGAVPTNEGRGYVLRRILRRAVRFGRQQLGVTEPFVHKLVDVVVDAMGAAFPELKKNPKQVIELIKDEEISFGRTIDRGIELFEEAATRAKQSTNGATNATTKADALLCVGAADAFKLHDTYGFPLDLTEVMAQERGMTVDVEGFKRLMEEAKDKARGGGDAADATTSLTELVQRFKFPATQFFGYEQTKLDAVTCVHVFRLHGATYEPVEHAAVGDKVALVLERTCFYAESGGQVGDRGTIENRFGAVVTVEDTIKIGDVFFHLGTVTRGPQTAPPAPGMGASSPHAQGAPTFVSAADDSKPHRLRVDESRRGRIASNHTMTHVMNHKLRAILGDHVAQKGSLVDDEKTRFDFAHNAGISEGDAAKIEELVNADIAADLPVHYDYAPQADALKIHGLRAVFGEKYPPTVRVVSIGPSLADLMKNPSNKEWENRSIEFCGGTHLKKTGDAEGFAIVSEEAVAKGVRRITAITGATAHKASASGQMLLSRVAALKTSASGMGASSPHAGTPQAHAALESLPAAVAEITTTLNEQQIPLLMKSKIREGLAELQRIVKEFEKEKSKAAAGNVVDAARQIAESAAGNLIVAEVPGADPETLRTAMDVIRKKCPDAAMLLGSVSTPPPASDGTPQPAKLSFLAAVPDALIKKGLKAGDWVKEVAKVAGGGGGGRPDVAQAGGKDPAKLADALEAGRKFAAGKMG